MSNLALTAGCQPDPSTAFFTQGDIPQLRVRLSPEQEEQLRQDPRRYVECTLTENDQTTYDKVRVKIKGSGGSRRDYDDRPALTLSLKKTGQRFHGLEKFHLNNSVQDESYLHELVASQVCSEAGCPTARVAHARVWLNDRDLGLYVLKEGYDDLFLSRNFHTTKGNLYDGGDCQDLTAEMEKDAGGGPDNHSDVKALIDACNDDNPERRWARVEKCLDVEAFLDFMAVERLLGHWDGYTQAANNYRVYFRVGDKRARFIPHGMDQVLEDPNYPVYQPGGGLVARTVLENPAWSEKYRSHVDKLLPLFAPARLQAKIDAGAARVRPAAQAIGEDFANAWEEHARGFRDRAGERQEGLLHPHEPEQVERLELNEEGWATVEGWEPRAEGGVLEETEHDGKACLRIAVGERSLCTASFRRQVVLAQGHYRLEARVATVDVVPTADEKGPGGAGLRISGAARENHVDGTTDWQTVSYEFGIDEESGGVELIAELRASAGSAFFEIESLRVVKVE